MQADGELLRAARTAVLDEDELLELLEARAREAVAAAGPHDPRASDLHRRLMVGLQQALHRRELQGTPGLCPASSATRPLAEA